MHATPLRTRLLRGLLRRDLARLGDPAALEDMRRWLSARQLDVAAGERRAAAARVSWPDLRSADGRERLHPVIAAHRTPWGAMVLPPFAVPGMVTAEERRYYRWLGRFHAGVGEAVELGCWLGCSTLDILGGLLANPRFAGRRLHVFDGFVWDAYMGSWYDGTPPAVGASFRPLFDLHTAHVASHLEVEACAILPSSATEGLPPLYWRGGLIELCWVDCGKTREVNEAWFAVLSPHFLPDRTLIVMQDWGCHRSGVAGEAGAKDFTDAHPGALALLHELRDGTVATFLYRGAAVDGR